jgi:hypothetical protein
MDNLEGFIGRVKEKRLFHETVRTETLLLTPSMLSGFCPTLSRVSRRPARKHRMNCHLASLLFLLSVLGSACASSTGAVPKPFPMPTRPATPPDAAAPGGLLPSPGAFAIVATALQLRGTPYRNGGSDPDGFDCSGFTQYVYARHQIALPRETRDQFRAGRSINLGDVVAGDLLFFTTTEPGASHVGIALGPDEFVHAPSSNGVVRIERLSTPYWAQRYLGARRVTEN